ncbi:LytTR family DNA-binding domain-containing protein [Paenibacillus sp. GCM10027626]|uniref:LytTR family DNA-binding domain-containing protein n=1 Tax=Paenibacillus sp. GCM10027626 TaxID=3273411 RepID=UPI003643CCF4
MQECNHLSVTLDIDGNQGLELVEIRDITYFEYDSIINRIIVHTLDKHYYTMGTLKYFVESLNSSGFNFKLVDRNNAANIDNVVYMDNSTKMAYFEWPVTKHSKGCTFSRKHFAEVEGQLSGKGQISFA